ncbi:MAG: ankyrin repeat domain-containing protein [Acidobacteriaceae bacterium]|nr:ankyrin repeat domain-containing protein [Acidobacteriaceae bacterium]
MTDVKNFQESVKKGDLSAVRVALSEDPHLLDATNEAGQSAFLLAMYYRQRETADYLLSLGPRLDIFNACVAGDTKRVMGDVAASPELLQAHSSDGWTPLHLAAFFGRPELASALLDAGANVDALSTNAMKNTPLHAAAAGGHAKLVELLLKRGADPNSGQEGGWTALHSAAQAGNREMVEVLLANGANVNARAANNQSPLDLALSKGHQDIAALLEQLGAKLQ